LLAIAQLNETGEIFWCSQNWPYITGLSFLKTIGSKVEELFPGYKLVTQPNGIKITVHNRDMYLYDFQLTDSRVLIIEDRSGTTDSLSNNVSHADRVPEAEESLQDSRTEGEWSAGMQRSSRKSMYEQKIREQPFLFAELPSQQMQTLFRYTNKVAATDATILILGETGVGKEGMAHYVHQMSNRSGKPFVKINCGAIPETLIEAELFGYAQGAYTGAEKGGKKGVFEEADGGTLFLDEIGELPLASQVKLLQVLQDRSFKKIGDTKTISVDVRIIAATNKDLEQEVALGRFREDLYYRLCVLPIEIPPLRQRTEDIETLIAYFVQKFQSKYRVNRTISPDVLCALTQYSWPGNIRQLENVIERMMVTAEERTISHFDLPASIREKIYPVPVQPVDKPLGRSQKGGAKPILIQQVISLKEATMLVEKELLSMAKELSSSTYEIARMLGVDQSTVSRKMKQYAVK
jgi:transcriptional regulator with PAS, ATPase and Fis domain